MKKIAVRIVSMVLCLCMMIPMFAGCSQKKENDDIATIAFTQSVEQMSSEADKLSMTLTLETEKFVDGITASDISLAGSFETMTVTSAIASGSELKIELAGKPSKNANLGVYTNGNITISGEKISNAEASLTVGVAIDSVNVYADYAQVTIANGKLLLPLTLSTQEWTDKAAASMFTVEGLTVSAFEKKDGNPTAEKKLLYWYDDNYHGYLGGKVVVNDKFLTFQMFDYAEKISVVK